MGNGYSDSYYPRERPRSHYRRRGYDNWHNDRRYRPSSRYRRHDYRPRYDNRRYHDRPYRHDSPPPRKYYDDRERSSRPIAPEKKIVSANELFGPGGVGENRILKSRGGETLLENDDVIIEKGAGMKLVEGSNGQLVPAPNDGPVIQGPSAPLTMAGPMQPQMPTVVSAPMPRVVPNSMPPIQQSFFPPIAAVPQMTRPIITMPYQSYGGMPYGGGRYIIARGPKPTIESFSKFGIPNHGRPFKSFDPGVNPWNRGGLITRLPDI